MADTESMAYIGIAPCCGNAVMAVVDEPETKAMASRHVAKAIRDGLTVKRVTVEEVRNLLRFGCHCKDKPKRAQANQAVQDVLLAVTPTTEAAIPTVNVAPLASEEAAR